MTPEQLKEHRARLNLTTQALSMILRVNSFTVRRWNAGAKPIPHAVALLLPRLSPDDVAAMLVVEKARIKAFKTGKPEVLPPKASDIPTAEMCEALAADIGCKVTVSIDGRLTVLASK